ncbi:hypothetical protein AB3N61_00070 [Leptospira sp. WS58.C1]|uniref:hypothetical protein n=1 Tax=Leptospira TaxID=171 RepID=UPI0002BE3C8E|nr:MULTISPECIES: hypothetical protein [unclassified Leptospira]EMJ99802.1 hypothetical protein LEP1GSC192_0615 [Leptospira sp. B5-022]MCR1792136.1 hypothetical protein [Leptospira sp. id769339]
MRISDGVQRISAQEDYLTYIKPILNQSRVPAIEPIRQRDFSETAKSLKFYGPDGSSAPQDSSVSKGRFLDLYV